MAVALLWLVTSPAWAATITVSPTSAAQGASVTIAGNVPVTGAASCPSGASAQLTSTAGLFPPDGFGPQASREPTGTFTISYTVPASTPAGPYEIGIRCAGGNVGVSATLQVIRAVTTTTARPTTTAPPTDGDRSGSVLPWIGLGVGVGVLVALVVLLAALRRRDPPRSLR